MKKLNILNSVILLVGALFLTIAFFSSGCSDPPEKPKKTIEELLINPENETYEEALDRQYALRTYPNALDDFELYGDIMKATDEVDKKIRLMEWEEGPSSKGSDFDWRTILLIIAGVVIVFLIFKTKWS